MDLHVVILVAAAAVVVFAGYKVLERAWRRRVLLRVARRVLPVAPANLRPPTDLNLIPYDGWLFIGPSGAASPCERRPPSRTRSRRVRMPGDDHAGFYDLSDE
jgi:hypothetical protein